MQSFSQFITRSVPDSSQDIIIFGGDLNFDIATEEAHRFEEILKENNIDA